MTFQYSLTVGNLNFATTNRITMGVIIPTLSGTSSSLFMVCGLNTKLEVTPGMQESSRGKVIRNPLPPFTIMQITLPSLPPVVCCRLHFIKVISLFFT